MNNINREKWLANINQKLYNNLEDLEKVIDFSKIEFYFKYHKNNNGMNSTYDRAYQFNSIKELILEFDYKINKSIENKQYKISKAYFYFEVLKTNKNKGNTIIHIIENNIEDIKELKNLTPLLKDFFLKNLSLFLI